MERRVDFDGLVNVSEGIIKQARKDFIKGAKILYKRYKRVPTRKEWYEMRQSDTGRRDIHWCYDAWEFVERDPYNMFGEIGAETIINSWKEDMMIDFYRDIYLPVCEKLIRKMKIGHTYKGGDKKGSGRRPISKKDLCLLSENELSKYLHGLDFVDFTKSRDYILAHNRKDVLDTCTSIALERIARDKKKLGKNTPSIVERR